MENPAAAAHLAQDVKRLSTLIEVKALISSTLNLDQISENMMAISRQVMNAFAFVSYPPSPQRGEGRV